MKVDLHWVLLAYGIGGIVGALSMWGLMQG